MRARTRGDGDQGFAIVLAALVLLLLMVIAALAVDLGGVYNARRNDQNAADTGAMGGALSLNDTNANIAIQVKTQVHATLGETLTAAQWNSCGATTDPDPVDIAISGSNCITLNPSRTRVQVRIPTRQVDAVFGKAAGITDFDHSAFAIAGLAPAGFGGILPFGMPVSAGQGDSYSCIKSGSGGTTVEPCGGPESGNFGYVDFSEYGNSELGTTQDCGNGQQRQRSANNMAVGVDHDLSKLSGFWNNVIKVDTTGCGSVPQTSVPNSMDTLTGNTVSQALQPGMAFGTGFSDGGPGRLARKDAGLFNGSGSMTSVGGTELDNNPLWEFIPTSFPVGTNVPTSCAKSVFTDVLGGNLSNLPVSVRNLLTPKQKPERMRLLLQRCFTHYNGLSWTANGAIAGTGEPTSCSAAGCTDAVFSRNSSTSDSPDLYDIQYTSRFAYVPQMTTDFPNGNSTVSILSFRAIFLQRMLGGCNSNTCGTDVEPGLGINYSGVNKDLTEITAFVFPANMLPNGLSGSDAPFAIGKNRFVSLMR